MNFNPQITNVWFQEVLLVFKMYVCVGLSIWLKHSLNFVRLFRNSGRTVVKKARYDDDTLVLFLQVVGLTSESISTD